MSDFDSDFPHPRSSRPTVAEIDLGALGHNVAATRAHLQKTNSRAQIMAIVKANAYGHGMARIARELIDSGVEQLGVAFVEEGIALRQSGIDVPILVLGGIIGDQVGQFIEHDLMISASSLHKLEQIEATARSMKTRAQIHVKIDTGMERLGIHHYNAGELFEAVTRAKNCVLCGVFSHLANSESSDKSFTEIQTQRFEEATAWFDKNKVPMPPRHLANSGAILQHPQTVFDIARPGLLLYGIYPSPDVERTVELQPVLSLKTRVVFFKVVEQGARVGYDGTWTAPRQTRVVTLPVGYGDGYRRSLSNRGSVLIRGCKYPIVGNVSMDQITVNIGGGTAYNDDEVVLLGAQDGETISVEDVAKWSDTISYEVLTGINTRVPRVYVKEVDSKQ